MTLLDQARKLSAFLRNEFLRQTTPLSMALAGGMFLLLFGITAQPDYLLIAAAFGAALIVQTWQPEALLLPFIVGLVLLPFIGDATAWVSLAGLALLLIPERNKRLLLLIPALLGVVLTQHDFLPQWIVLGLGALLLGALHAHLSAVQARAIADAAPTLTPSPTISKPATRLDTAALDDRMQYTADGMIKAAQAINEVTQQQVNGSGEQSDVIRMTNQLLDNFLAMGERVGQYTRALTRSAQEAETLSVSGETALQLAQTNMIALRAQVNAISQTIVRLAQLTHRIDTIITSVSEIATQSHLLALNASIEAARAGTQGRGFAVVADEVRSLAQQSTTASRQVREILGEIQSAVKETIDAAESGSQQVAQSTQQTQEANAIMQKLSGDVAQAYQTIKMIGDIIREQADGMENIAIDMERLDRITQQSTVSTRVVEQVAQNLLRLADELESTLVSVRGVPVNTHTIL